MRWFKVAAIAAGVLLAFLVVSSVIGFLTNWHDHGSRAGFPASSAVRHQRVRLARRAACATAAVTCGYATKVTIYNCRMRVSCHNIKREQAHTCSQPD